MQQYQSTCQLPASSSESARLLSAFDAGQYLRRPASRCDAYDRQMTSPLAAASAADLASSFTKASLA
jgi:hypothetical protein